MKIEKNLQSSKNTFKRYVDLLLIEKEDQSSYVLIKDFNTFMYNQTLHHDGKIFCRYCLQSLTIAKVLTNHVNDCFEINGTQMIKMAKKCETVKTAHS